MTFDDSTPNNLNIFAFLSPILPKQYNENIKNHKVPEKVGPENRKPKFYNSLGLDQCDRNPKTNSEFLFFFAEVNWKFHKRGCKVAENNPASCA